MGAVRVLEKALAEPAPGVPDAWKHRAAAALAIVVDYVRQHIESAESDGGLVTELELKLGRNRDVRLARDDHKKLLAGSNALLADLSQPAGDAGPETADVRSRTLDLIALLEQHKRREIDLILGAFDIDIGTGD